MSEQPVSSATTECEKLLERANTEHAAYWALLDDPEVKAKDDLFNQIEAQENHDALKARERSSIEHARNVDAEVEGDGA